MANTLLLLVAGSALLWGTAFTQSRPGFPGTNQTGCAPNPCLNGGSCISRIYHYGYPNWSCMCKVGYSGYMCENVHTDPCKKTGNPCQNNGVCNSKYSNGLFTLACICPKSHIGPKCQYQNPCFENPCVNGLCQASGNHTGEKFSCQCNGGFEGKLCDTPTPVLCTADKCKNNGICYQTFNYTKGISEAKCYCNGKWGGKDCSEDISNPCQSGPCGNNGECRNGQRGQFYCACKPGFMGKNCEHADPCFGETCSGFGLCLLDYIYINATIKYKFLCSCDTTHAGKRCEFLNPCINNNPCLNGGRCHSYAMYSNPYYRFCFNSGTANSTGFSPVKCICPNIFGGKHCETLSPCIKNNPCQNGGVCISNGTMGTTNKTNFIQFPTPQCKCPHDYTGKNCEVKVVNPCEEDPCQNEGICMVKGNVKDAFECKCMGGYTGKTCEEKDPKITSCNFENKLCPGFTTIKTGTYAWLIKSGSTRSYNTGPTKAKEGRYYIYTEASSPAKPGDKAYIRSNFFTTESESCVSMDYHMYGNDIGSLTVKVENSDGEMTSNDEISIAGNKGNNWFSLELNVKPGTWRISILGVRGKNWAGDIAIDNIVWNGKPCKDDGEGGGGQQPGNGEPDK